MRYKLVTVTPLMQNCTIAACMDTRKAVVVDPGGEVDRIVEAIEHLELTVERVLLTHGHIDHVAGADELRRRLGVTIEGPHQADDFWLRNMSGQALAFDFPPTDSFEPDRWLNDGDTITVGNATLSVLHCPGHTPGHIAFYNAADKLALVGDVLFRGSVGRTDFPKGSHEELLESIRNKLFPLGDDVSFIPGHGPHSSFGAERRSNPFLV